MTAINTAEYQRLELSSSNDIIRHDARRSDRKYAEAAWHAFQAGEGRRKMGILAKQAGDFPQAIADWLSACACFYLATAPTLLRAGLDKVRELDAAGRIPPERADLHQAIRERERELIDLERRLATFLTEYRHRYGALGTAGPERLKFLQQSVRDFPGFARLHYAIHLSAEELGDEAVANAHLRWAAEFDADEAEYVSRYAHSLLTSGRADLAAEIARHFLTKHPSEGSVRVVLAQTLALPGGDQQAAVEMLRGVAADEAVSPGVRLVAVALLAAIRRNRGEDAEVRLLLGQFDQIAIAIESPIQRDRIARLREILTAAPARVYQDHDAHARLADPVRSELFRSDGVLLPTH